MSIFTRKKRSQHELASERTKLIAEQAAAQIKRDALVEGRREIEIYESVEALIAHDAEMAHQKLIADRAAARLEQIQRDEWALAAEADQARRQAIYDAASKAHAEGRNALRDYERHAANAADALARYATAKAKIDAANLALPNGKSPVEDPEPFAGVHAYMPKPKPALSWDWGKGESHNHELPRAAKPHISVLTRAVLPKLGERDGYYYGAENVPDTRGYYNR